MRKAPRLSAVNGREKRQDSLDAGNTSPTSSQESAPSSVAPASSPATSRSHSRIGSEAGREIVTTTPRQPSRTNYDIPKSVDATGEVKDSSRMTIAIDYGTTFTGETNLE